MSISASNWCCATPASKMARRWSLLVILAVDPCRWSRRVSAFAEIADHEGRLMLRADFDLNQTAATFCRDVP
jgi:hypothetical protein